MTVVAKNWALCMSNVSLFGAEFCSLHAMEGTYFSEYILNADLNLHKMVWKPPKKVV